MTRTFLPVFIMAILFDGCGARSETSKLYFHNLRIQIISPYGCYQEIRLAKSGAGEFLQGLPTTSILSEEFKFDTLYSKADFLINDASAMDSITSVVSGISKANFFGGYKNDGYRVIVLIDDKEQYDAFGHSVLTHKLIDVLDKFLKDQQKFCEYFSVFHPTK